MIPLSKRLFQGVGKALCPFRHHYMWYKTEFIIPVGTPCFHSTVTASQAVAIFCTSSEILFDKGSVASMISCKFGQAKGTDCPFRVMVKTSLQSPNSACLAIAFLSLTRLIFADTSTRRFLTFSDGCSKVGIQEEERARMSVYLLGC